MLVPAAKEVIQAQDDVSISTKPSTSKPHKKHKYKKQQPKAPKVPFPTPSQEHQLPSPSNDQILTAKDSLTLQELVDLCTRLSNKVLDLESEVIDIKSSFTAKIQKLEDRVAQLEEENKALKEKPFKTTQVNTAAPEEHAEVEEVLEVVKAAKLMTEVVTTAQPTTTAAQSKDKGKGILIEEPKPLKGQAQIDMDEAFETTKIQRMDKEVDELKRHLQIMANDDDDVFIEATPLASKNFNKEDLKALWKLVKERFETIKPKNFSDDFLLNILKIMFEKPSIEANVWKYQKGRYGLAKYLWAGNPNLSGGGPGVDIVFDGAFGGARDEEVVVGECVVVIPSSLDMLTNNCLGGIMVSLIFLEELDEEALVEFMVEWYEEDEDDDRKEFMI
nr:hypothetical protein [Tanacetum cinerariifolium]